MLGIAGVRSQLIQTKEDEAALDIVRFARYLAQFVIFGQHYVFSDRYTPCKRDLCGAARARVTANVSGCPTGGEYEALEGF